MVLLLISVSLAAFVNSLHSVSIKYLLAGGVLRALPATFLVQALAGMIAAVSLLFGRVPWVPAAMPMVLGVACIALIGFIFMMAAFAREDASVVGPILGVKVIFLAFLESALRGESVGVGIWLGAVVSMVAITFISQTDRWTLHPRDLLRPGVLIMGLSALSFSISDLFLKEALVRWDADSWSVTSYILTLQGGLSLLLLAVLVRLPVGRALGMGEFTWPAVRAVRFPLLLAAVTAFGYQYFFFTAFALGDGLTQINILYNTRNLLVVLIMAFLVLGRGSVVERAGWRAYTYRTIGAVLTMVALALALFVA